jgi:hypothetical protein
LAGVSQKRRVPLELLAHLRRARDHIDRNYREPLDRDRWAARGGPHVPGCYLFMRGVFDHRGTAGSRNLEEDRRPGHD